MVDLDAPPSSRRGPAARRVTRARGLPGGRAVLGALLVAAAAVGVFAAQLRATAEPTTRYLVAAQDIDAGTRVDADNLAALFGHLPLDLAPAIAERSVLLDDREQLVGHVVTAPLTRGDLVSRTAVVDDAGAPEHHTMSFAVAAADAVSGDLRRGQHVDVLATYGSGADAYTAYVVVDAPVVAIRTDDASGFGSDARRVLTLALADREQVQALAHAVAVADIVVTRAPDERDVADDPPSAYRPPGRVGRTADPTDAADDGVPAGEDG